MRFRLCGRWVRLNCLRQRDRPQRQDHQGRQSGTHVFQTSYFRSPAGTITAGQKAATMTVKGTDPESCKEDAMDHTWTCGCCGRTFDTLPMDYGFAAPRNWFGLPEAERATRAKLTDDICTIDDTER